MVKPPHLILTFLCRTDIITTSKNCGTVLFKFNKIDEFLIFFLLKAFDGSDSQQPDHPGLGGV